MVVSEYELGKQDRARQRRGPARSREENQPLHRASRYGLATEGWLHPWP
jgi:hypothetical protein